MKITAKVADDHRIQTLPNGRCIQILPSGNTFEGDYRDDKKHGRGIYTFASGNRYEGDFIDGKRHGRGIYSRANKDR